MPWDLYLFPDFDYPPVLQPDAEFPSGKRVHEYIKAYASQFNLYSHIQFNSRLVQLKQLRGGTWNVLYLDTAYDRFYQVQADFVVMCTGLYSQPYIPNYEVGGALHGPMILHGKLHDAVMVPPWPCAHATVNNGHLGCSCIPTSSQALVAGSPVAAEMQPCSSRLYYCEPALDAANGHHCVGSIAAAAAQDYTEAQRTPISRTTSKNSSVYGTYWLQTDTIPWSVFWLLASGSWECPARTHAHAHAICHGDRCRGPMHGTHCISSTNHSPWLFSLHTTMAPGP